MCGRGFSYHGKHGHRIRYPRIIARLHALPCLLLTSTSPIRATKSRRCKRWAATPPAAGSTVTIRIASSLANAASAATSSV